MSLINRKLVVAIALCGATGCSGGPNAGAVAPLAPRSAQLVPVTVRLSVPNVQNARTNAQRRALFVASNTGGILVQTYAQTDTTHSAVLGQVATDVSSGSSACGGQTGNVRTCTFTVNAPAGADTLVITSYDGAPVNGGFTGKNQLAAAAINQTISSSSANTVNVTLGGVVKSLQIIAPSPSMHGTVAASQNLAIEAFDADGNFIATDSYVDTSGNAVSVSLQATPNTGNVFSLASSSLSGPSATGDQLSYNGTASAPFTTTITASAGTISASTTVALAGPSFNEYSTPTASAGVGGIALAVYGATSSNLYFTEPSANKIGIITPAGVITEFSPGGTAPLSIASGPHSGFEAYDLFYTASGSSQIEAIDTSATSNGSTSTATASSTPVGIAYGPDGNMWYTESGVSKIGVYKLSSVSMADYSTTTASANPQYIVAGSDGRLWFTEQSANKIGAITTAGTVTEYSIPTSSSQPFGIASGADGNLWFTEQAGNKIGVITTAGTVTEYSLPTASASPAQIAQGADGNLWFLESAAHKLARIDISTHVVTEYTPPTASTLSGITAGPDGEIWFGENGASKIGRFVW